MSLALLILVMAAVECVRACMREASCRAVSAVLEELYWRRLVFHYLLFPAELRRVGHLITVYYSKTAPGSMKNFPPEEEDGGGS